MNKWIALLLLCMLLPAAGALAEAPVSVKDMTDEDLLALYGQCVGEMALRNKDGQIWYQNEEGTVTIRMTGMWVGAGNDLQLGLYYQILNGTDETVTFTMRNVAVNSWEVDDVTFNIKAASPHRNSANYAQIVKLKYRVGWETPGEAMQGITRVEFDLHVIIGEEEIVAPVVITDFAGLALDW